MKKRNRKLRKALMMLCCALALIAISVGATLAYLTDTEAVTNTFTVGKVGLSLDETKTNTDGTPVSPAERTHSNVYHLIPGSEYTKDPIVHVDANSEPSWLFVKVENSLADIEDAATYINKEGQSASGTIAQQLTAFGWTELTAGIYYQKHENKVPDSVNYPVFKAFKLKGEGLVNGTGTNTDTTKYIGNYESDEDNGVQIKVTAYAIQAAGFETAAEAWNAGEFGMPVVINP